MLTSRAIYRPIECPRKGAYHEMRSLGTSMLEPDSKKRATVQSIVCRPLVMSRYYSKYFLYD